MTPLRIAVIVEGHGEVEAAPILIRRIAREWDTARRLEIKPPLRVPASKLLRKGELEKSVERAARMVGGQGGILVLLDCDWKDGCPAHDGPALLKRATTARPDLPISVVLAKKEFEAWFIAAAESLRGKRGLPKDLAPAPHPEEIRGAKEWLSEKMPRGCRYAETTDQPALTHLFDMTMAKERADSFDKCYREILALLGRLERSS